MGIQFGSFNGICETAALVICPLVGTAQGVVPTCYSRNVDIGRTLIFQPCKLPLFLRWLDNWLLLHPFFSFLQQHVSYISSPSSWPPLWSFTLEANTPPLVGKKSSCFSGYMPPSVYSPCSLTQAWYRLPMLAIRYRPTHFSFFFQSYIFKVVRSYIYGTCSCCLLLLTHQWICGFPTRRGWNTIISLGEDHAWSRYMPS